MKQEWEIVEGIPRKPYYSLEEASQFLGQSIRKIKSRADLHIERGGMKGETARITYSCLFPAHLNDVKMGYGKRYPELEAIYKIVK